MAIITIVFLINDRADLADKVDELTVQVEDARQIQAADQARTECIRDLGARLNDADVNNSVAFNRYVIGLGNRGDIPTLQAELDAAGLALQQARDAYVTGC